MCVYIYIYVCTYIPKHLYKYLYTFDLYKYININIYRDAWRRRCEPQVFSFCLMDLCLR